MIPFFPVRFPILNDKINYRNHRKIVIIDGNEGFVGGLNIGDEYLGKDKYFGFWRDTHLYLRGEAVQSLQLIFLQDWFYMTGEAVLALNIYKRKQLRGSIGEACSSLQVDRIINGKQLNIYILP